MWQTTDEIVKETEVRLNRSKEPQRMAQVRSLYGDGRTSERIIDVLLSCICEPRMLTGTPKQHQE